MGERGRDRGEGGDPPNALPAACRKRSVGLSVIRGNLHPRVELPGAGSPTTAMPEINGHGLS
jgi:hypothetical protein